MDSIDYKVGLSTDPNAQASLTALKQQLTDIYELSQKINATAIRISGGGGGGGSGAGGGGGSGGIGGAAGRAAAGSAGLPIGGLSGDAFDEMMYGFTGNTASAMSMAQATAAGLSGSKESRRAQAIAMGMQAAGYAAEDLYMGGMGGVINNVPMIARGFLQNREGWNENDVTTAVAGVSGVSLAAYMAYRNRDSVYSGLGITDMMSRENVGFLGVAAKTESEKAAKLASDADYYVQKYGAGSVSGQRYMREGADASVDAQLKATQEVNASQLAQTKLAPTTAEVMSADALRSLRVNEGDLRSVFESMGVSDPAKAATLTSRALGGDTDTLRRRAESDPNDPLVSLSQNLSRSQRFQIDKLRSEANSPYSDVEGNLRQIRSILANAGAGDQADPVAQAIGAQMAAQQGDAMSSPEEGLAANYGRYSRNIGAALGGIEMNSRSGGIRAAQVKNLQMRVYQDLLGTGMSPDQAGQAAQSLYASGTNNYRNMVGNAQGNPNGFMNQMDQEQQAAFQMQSQTYNQVLWVRSAMRRNLMMQQSRRGFRGAF